MCGRGHHVSQRKVRRAYVIRGNPGREYRDQYEDRNDGNTDDCETIHCQFPIANCRFSNLFPHLGAQLNSVDWLLTESTRNQELAIANWQSAITRRVCADPA